MIYKPLINVGIGLNKNNRQVRYLLQLLSGVAWCERSADGDTS